MDETIIKAYEFIDEHPMVITIGKSKKYYSKFILLKDFHCSIAIELQFSRSFHFCWGLYGIKQSSQGVEKSATFCKNKKEGWL